MLVVVVVAGAELTVLRGVGRMSEQRRHKERRFMILHPYARNSPAVWGYLLCGTSLSSKSTWLSSTNGTACRTVETLGYGTRKFT